MTFADVGLVEEAAVAVAGRIIDGDLRGAGALEIAFDRGDAIVVPDPAPSDVVSNEAGDRGHGDNVCIGHGVFDRGLGAAAGVGGGDRGEEYRHGGEDGCGREEMFHGVSVRDSNVWREEKVPVMDVPRQQLVWMNRTRSKPRVMPCNSPTPHPDKRRPSTHPIRHLLEGLRPSSSPAV